MKKKKNVENMIEWSRKKWGKLLTSRLRIMYQDYDDDKRGATTDCGDGGGSDDSSE